MEDDHIDRVVGQVPQKFPDASGLAGILRHHLLKVLDIVLTN